MKIKFNRMCVGDYNDVMLFNALQVDNLHNLCYYVADKIKEKTNDIFRVKRAHFHISSNCFFGNSNSFNFKWNQMKTSYNFLTINRISSVIWKRVDNTQNRLKNLNLILIEFFPLHVFPRETRVCLCWPVLVEKWI